jgi:hypothetical protein
MISDEEKDRLSKLFLQEQKNIGTNFAVVWFMVSALKYFENMPRKKIMSIAYDIAMKGTKGISPQKEYTILSIPNKIFSGYHLLAYYYVSWKLCLPAMVKDLRLPFDREYEIAEGIFKMGVK